MTDVNSISTSALDAYSSKLNVTANNVANTNTDNFQASRVTMQQNKDGGVSATVQQTNDQVDISREAVDMLSTVNGYKANLQVLKAGNEMSQSLLDIIS